jgi:diguanylate cyclase (GGDEF)-like protein
MMKKVDSPTDFTEFRRRAEARYEQIHAQEGSRPPQTDLQSLVHEFEVHQIELEFHIEELQRAQAEVEARLERYSDLYDFAPIGYFILRRDGTVSQANLSGALLLGVERVWLEGRWFGLFVADGDVLEFNNFLEHVFESHVKQTCEVMLQKEGQEPFWVQIEGIAVAEWQECWTVVVDIRARRLAEKSLQYLSMHDPLTGLYNRSYFIESIGRLERGRHFPISILMADVDHQKNTNDREGYIAGDDMLKRVAHVLTIAFRSEDVIARIGGDEFAVLLPDTNAKAAEVALLRLHDIIQEHNTNYFTEKPLKLSFGISTAAEYGFSLMETLKDADARMVRQKREGNQD